MTNETLPDALQREIDRNRELFEMYQTIGNAGAFARLFVAERIRLGVNALASGDAVAMVKALAQLRQSE